MELFGAPRFQQQVTPIHFVVCLLFELLEKRLDQHPVSFSKPVFVLELDNFFLLVQVRFSCLKNPLRIHIFVPTGIALQGKWKNWHFLVLFHLEKKLKSRFFRRRAHWFKNSILRQESFFVPSGVGDLRLRRWPQCRRRTRDWQKQSRGTNSRTVCQSVPCNIKLNLREAQLDPILLNI